jgi:hypothetical protein
VRTEACLCRTGFLLGSLCILRDEANSVADFGLFGSVAKEVILEGTFILATLGLGVLVGFKDCRWILSFLPRQFMMGTEQSTSMVESSDPSEDVAGVESISWLVPIRGIGAGMKC